jgi:ABC-2 type transport system permease protein
MTMSVSTNTSALQHRRGPRPQRAAPAAVRAYLALELRRTLRHRRTLIFSVAMPPVLFWIFGTQDAYAAQSAGTGNVTAWIAVSMALYGAIMNTTAGGAGVSVERSQGWTRQLRLTPLRPAAYVVVKVAAAMTLGAASVSLTLLVGAVGGARMPFGTWIACGLLAWAGSLVFAAFGLFMGYLLPAENVMQILGPALALLGFAGGLFMPLGDGWFATLARFLPTSGIAELARAPLSGDVGPAAVVNAVAWAAIFGCGAAWRFRQDTARV